MRSYILKGALFTILIFLGWSHEKAFADMTFPSKCTSFGTIQPNQNPSPQQMNCLLTGAALEANIPPEVVKAVASQENGSWAQFTADGQPNISSDGGIGVMQITNQSSYDQERLKTDIAYNIEAGVEILSSMYDRTDLPKITGADRDVIENWYFPVMAYNGTKPVNSPLIQATGSNNPNAYQEKVFTHIENDSYLTDTPLAQFPFQTTDFNYDPNSDQNIAFNKLEYTITDQMHASNYLFKTGDKVVVTMDGVNLRSTPDTRSSQSLAENTSLIIDGDFVYSQPDSSNQFVWYPVETADKTLSGYISSAYITKELDPPVVNPVYDNDLIVSGKAPANAVIQIMKGTSLIGSAATDANGNFKTQIPVQKAAPSLTLTYKDHLNAVSLPANVTVQHYVLTGWVTGNGKRYHRTNGVVNTGWYNDGGNYYYLDPSNGGAMKTGWLSINNQWFYLNPTTGVKTTSSWVSYGGSKYYFNAYGVMQTGWMKLGSYYYYFNSNGAMKTGWLSINSQWFYLNPTTGVKTTSAWVSSGGKKYYLNAYGVMQTGWLKLGIDWYFFDQSTGAMRTGWVKDGKNWYYLYSNGKMAHDTTIGNYRLGHSGAMI